MFPNPIPVPMYLAVILNVLVAFGLPIGGAILCKKQGAKLRFFFLGAAVFVIFVMVLESGLHQLVFSSLGEKLTGNTVLYALYGGLAAAAFEEVGRYLAMKFFMKKDLVRKNALMYGVGHGGMEAILLVGLAYVSNLIAMIMISTGSMETSLAAMDEAARAVQLAQLQSYWTVGAGAVVVAGYERLIAVILHICLSYLVYRTVKTGSWKFFWKAFALHFIVDAATVMMVNVMSIFLLEAILTVAIVAIVGYCLKLVRQENAQNRAVRKEN